MFMRDTGSVVFISYIIFGFCVKIMRASQNELGSILSASIFWKTFGGIHKETHLGVSVWEGY